MTKQDNAALSDRELLELAAKAVGIEIKMWSPSYQIGTIKPLALIGEDFMPWDPPTDDGDAFRLMTMLNMDVRFEAGEEGAYVRAVCDWDDRESSREVDLGKDAPAATRRAILLCAAAIGEAA